jgi:hypothetical protein
MSRRLTVDKDQEARQLATKKKTLLRRHPELQHWSSEHAGAPADYCDHESRVGLSC